jgi:hypothetical protein
LSTQEENLAQRVFSATLPPWNHIGITDSLGFGDRPWTSSDSNDAQLTGPLMGPFWINVGPECYADCTVSIATSVGLPNAVFIHEMTHVWQYHHRYFVKFSSIWAQTLGDGYGYTIGQAWNDYNVEQQAKIVEHWYRGGMNAGDDRFHYVDKVVRRGGGPGASKSLADLKAWTP